ncbi:cell division protein DivIVA [Erysipelotrichaceae bacterium I46]|uniref:DivIVA domain-containing protein n=1 Tax=Clostridium innocuum TaxID=1522 RepID=UPI00080CAB2E|nr:DivIVA domain-containing protein [[Clostridium] innocuum]ANU69442.1 cell division protein DivIVA [Erysipelotrichaceae bacterium I46]ASU18125.1 cell division protein DivIVA [[Clostridium] innocuum]QQR26672.1 DivIVA domain-containing protein [[Clostridium] innocuum]
MDRYAFDTMKNGYNRYQVEDYIQTQKLQMESLQKKLEKANLLKEELTREYQELETRYRDVSGNLEVKEKAADEMTRMAMKEANMIVDTAHRNADAIVKESLMMARGILMEVARLGDEANDLKGSMRKELQKITQALDDFEAPEIPDLDLLKKEI